MELILKSFGWNPIFPETIKRLTFFKNGFRDCFNQDEISDDDLEKSVAYAFGTYGQEMVYQIYSNLQKELVNGKAMGAIVKDFVKAFEESLEETTVAAIKPKHYIQFFIEFIYSCVIKGK